MKKLKSISGFSLLESLIAAAIAAIIITSLITFFIDVIQFKNQHSIQQELHYNMQFIIQTLGRDVKEATEINTAQSTLDIHPGILSLTKSNTSESPTTYQVVGNRLQLTRGSSGPNEFISTNRVNISQLIFSYDEPLNSTGIVTGTIRLQSTVDPTLFLNETFSFSLRIKN